MAKRLSERIYNTFRADHENRTKSGQGFFKLSNESIATVRKDLATDYQALADRHLEEVAQILEEYGAAEVEITHQLQTNKDDRRATGEQPIEIVELSDSSPEGAGPTPQEDPVVAAPPVSNPTSTEASDSGSIPIPDATEAATPLPTTLDAPPQAESHTTATREQPVHPEPTPELATTPTDLMPEPEPSEPLQTNEPTGAVETEAAVIEPPSITTPPTDPTPPEPSLLDIFHDA